MISETFYNSLIYNAKRRNLEFNVSLQYLNQLLKKQYYMCALSGRALIMPPPNFATKRSQFNLSLDRIDSSQGYVTGNVQFLDKDINMGKQSMSTMDFIRLCREVTTYNEKHSE